MTTIAYRPDINIPIPTSITSGTFDVMIYIGGMWSETAPMDDLWPDEVNSFFTVYGATASVRPRSS